MNFGVFMLIIVSGWCLLSIVVALAVGGMAEGRDRGLLDPYRKVAADDVLRHRTGATDRHHLAS
ncbi:MAG TPA: hypothetical protein VIK61_00745 [Acidimicrobiia bacterium]